MRLNKRNFFKIVKIFFIVVISIVFLAFFALYNDSSRKFVIDYVVSCLQSEDFSLKIEGTNKELTYVEKISARFSGNLIEAYNVNLKRDEHGLLFRPRIQIKKIIFQAANKKFYENNKLRSENKSIEKNSARQFETTIASKSDEVGFDVRLILDLVKKIKIFVKSLDISEATFSFGDRSYRYENLSYHTDGVFDFISMKMEHSHFNFELDWRSSVNLKGDFQNIEGFSGNVCINSLKDSNPKYKIEVKNSECKINVDGAFSNKLNICLISQSSIEYHGKTLNLKGKIFLNQNRAELLTKLSLSDFIDASKIPTEITKNFQDILANVTVEKKESSVISQIEFQRDERKLGNSSVVLREKNLSITSDVSWINFWGHNLKNLDIHSKNLKNFVVDISGTDILKEKFGIHSEVIYSKNVSVQSLICNLWKGKITLKKPFVLSEFGLDTLFKFDLNYFGFLKNFFEVKGSMDGNLFMKNGLLGIEAKIDQFMSKSAELYNGKVSGNANDLKIDVGSAKVMGNVLKNLILKKKNNALSFTSKLNNNSQIILNGNLDHEILSFSGNIQNKNASLTLKNCSFDLKNRSYKVSSEIKENKKLGKLQILVSPNEINLSAENFSVQRVGKIFNKNFPECLINGYVNLNPDRDCFSGTGHLKFEKLLSQRSNVDINLKQNQKGLFVQGNLRNTTDNLLLDVMIPIVIKRNFDCSISNNLLIKGSLNGSAHVENIFEFPDGVTMKGQIKSNLNISGSLGNPKIQGNVKYSNATIIVFDVVLENGMINLKGQDQKFIVYDSYFIDSYGKKAKINGSAVLFFSNIVPNLDTDLFLDFDNFRLFDTDSMKINVLGNGKMSGPIDNLKLSGQLKIPLCELKFSESGYENQYKDIIVTNDIFLSNQKNPKEDFFFYDLDLDSPLIKIFGDIYRLEFIGNLHLGTYNRQATLSGEIDLKKGKLNLFGKRMIFKKSKVEFFEKFPFDPKMKLSCSRDIEKMKVVLDVKNNPGEGMSLDLYSHPNFTQDVILSHMLFGKSIKDLSVGEAAQLAHALNSMSQRGYIFSILNTFQNIGLVDSLSFSTENNSSHLYKNSQSSSDKLNVRAGKYLNDNVYISVNKKEEETSFDVDLSIGSNTSLKVNTLGEVGVSWKFRY